MGFVKKALFVIALGAISYVGFKAGIEYQAQQTRSEHNRSRSEYLEGLRRIGPGEEGELGRLADIISSDSSDSDADVLEESVKAVARIGTQNAKMMLHDILVKESGDHIYGVVDRTTTEELYKLDVEMTVDAIIGARGWADHQMKILIENGDRRSLLYLIESDKDIELKEFVERNRARDYIERHKRSIIRVFEHHMRGGYPEPHDYFCPGYESTLEAYGRTIAAIDRDYAITNVVPKIRASCEKWINGERIEQLVQRLF